MMNVIQTVIIIFLLIIFGPAESLALDFIAGNYEVTNWIEIPGKGRGMQESNFQCLTDNDLGWRMCRDPECKVISENNSGNTLQWEFKCDSGSIDAISGSITYFGDSFDGTLIYRKINPTRSLTIGLKGKRIGDCQSTQ